MHQLQGVYPDSTSTSVIVLVDQLEGVYPVLTKLDHPPTPSLAPVYFGEIGKLSHMSISCHGISSCRSYVYKSSPSSSFNHDVVLML